MDGYVSKPIRPAALFAAIDELVSKGAPPAELAGEPLNGSEVLDEAGLLTLLDGDRRVLRELAALFLTDSPMQLQEMKSALEARSRGPLGRAAHTLKGSAASLGGARTAEAALRLEELAQDGDFAEAHAAYSLLGEEVAMLQQALSRLMGIGEAS
jgi:HPt (histidine-containing phosphotransfer) domain-containing protein